MRPLPVGGVRPDVLNETLLSHFRVLYRAQQRLGPSQIRNHEIQIRHLERCLGRPPILDDLTDETIGGVMQALVDAGRRPRTANKLADCLCAQWEFYARKGLIMRGHPPRPIYPSVRRFIIEDDPPVAWTRSQLNQLWQACEEAPGFIGSVRWSSWLHGIHAVMWDTGERVGACLDVQIRDVDLECRCITFRAAIRKGKRQGIVRAIHADTCVVLATIIEIRPPDAKVFPWPFCIGTLYNRYDRLLRRAGLPHDRSRKFHCMRKSVASWFEAAGGNATTLLDHSSRRVTRRYLDPKIVGAPSAAPLLFRPDATADIQ